MINSSLTSMDNYISKHFNINIQQIPETSIDPKDIKNENYFLDPKKDSKPMIANIQNNSKNCLLMIH